MTSAQTEALNALLRGEMAAAETYQQAISRVNGAHGWDELERLRGEHLRAAQVLRQFVLECGGEPDVDSGSWGAFAGVVESAAGAFGSTSALQALKLGEQQGVNDYETAAKNDNIPLECRSYVRSLLLPQTRSHVATLERIMSMQA